MREGERKPVVIGFDTSNYRTSVAAVTLDGEILVNHRELLPVPDGERGLRQSDAVFAHIRQLRNSGEELRTALQNAEIAAVAASTKPRDGEDSYMPVFQAGYTAGNLLAAALNVPFYPAGEALEALAVYGKSGGRLGCSMDNGGLTCHLSGAETKVQQWIREKTLPREDIAREIYDLLARTLIRMLQAGSEKTGIRQALITGGVAASALLRQMLEERRKKTRNCPEIVFGKPEMSGDNAVGVALIGAQCLKQNKYT